MTIKRVLCARRLRKIPAQFSWVDHRLVRDRHICRCGPEALALYLLLVTVADAEGLSYYSDRTAAGLISISVARLKQARGELLDAGLIAYRRPLYQVLSLDPDTREEESTPRMGRSASIAEILKGIGTEAP